MRWISGSKRLSPMEKERILWRNALTFLGMHRAGRYTAEVETVGPR